MAAAKRPAMLMVIIGGDALALRVVAELSGTAGQRVALVWQPDGDLEARATAAGAEFVAFGGDERETLLRAGVPDAGVLVALTQDDQLNLKTALLARDLNPEIRLVLRQFNRTLGRKIEQNLANCSVVSLSSQSAATYAGIAVDPYCYYGVQFPDIDGPLLGFSSHRAGTLGIAGRDAAQAEAHLGARLVARGSLASFDRAAIFEEGDDVVVFGYVRPHARPKARSRVRAFRRILDPALIARRFRQLDPVVRGAVLGGASIFALGSAFFSATLHVGPLRAGYFVLTTMTTTGYGDVVPTSAAGELVAMLLMLAGLAFTGIFIAVLATRFTNAQYVAVQGLRRISRRGHVVVCGAGNVGSRVVDYLRALGCDIVVIEVEPRAELIERARDRHIDLLTGDATKDTTLDLCNIAEASALIALTNNDTMNLEVALGARARNRDLPIVMRVQEEAFEKSVRRHFEFYNTHSTAALAAPVFAGLTRTRGVRGRVCVGELEYSIVELAHDAVLKEPPRSSCLPLGVWRDARFVPLASFDAARPFETVLMLVPVGELRGEKAAALRAAAGERDAE